MKKITSFLILCIFNCFVLGANCPIYPVPKFYEETGKKAELSQSAIIVINDKAEKPEIYAAKQLQSRIDRRFRINLPIFKKSEIKKGTQYILLEKAKKNLKSDGFTIEFDKTKNSYNVLIQGVNGRGVIYGQYAFFDLLEKENNQIVMPVCKVKDWPSIQLRGRLSGANADSNTYDIYTLSRLNMSDLEYPAISSKKPLNQERAKKYIELAHQRDMFIYGKVSCAVTKAEQDLSIKGFKEMLDCGVDGLWISFDDDGPGENPKLMVSKVLKLADKNNIPLKNIASTPPFVAYGDIKNSFHKQMCDSVSGYDKTLWFFTRVPCANDVDAAKNAGIKELPGWWYNWPRLGGGLLRQAYGGTSMRIGKPNYIYLPRLKSGWQNPDDWQLKQISNYSNAGGFLGSYILQYTCQIFGYLLWDPQGYDWNKASMKIYSEVFGKDAALFAKDYDDKMIELEDLMLVPVFRHPNNYYWPCRLKYISARSKALKILSDMQADLNEIKKTALEQGMCSEKILHDKFLEPMQATIDYTKSMVVLDYPEYAWQGNLYSRPTRSLLGDDIEYITPGQNEFARMINEAIAVGEDEKVQQKISEIQNDILSKLPVIEKSLSGLADVNTYTQNWRNYVSGLDYWKADAIKNHKVAMDKFDSLVDYDFDDLFERYGKIIEGKVLAEISPKQWLDGNFVYRGNWGLGIYKTKNGKEAAAIVFGKSRFYLCQADDFAELYTQINVPEHKGKLFIETFIGQRLVNRNENPKKLERTAKLYVNDNVMWQQEINEIKNSGWIRIPLGNVKAGDKLNIKFEIENLYEIRNCQSVSLFGPIRIIER